MLYCKCVSIFLAAFSQKRTVTLRPHPPLRLSEGGYLLEDSYVILSMYVCMYVCVYINTLLCIYTHITHAAAAAIPATLLELPLTFLLFITTLLQVLQQTLVRIQAFFPRHSTTRTPTTTATPPGAAVAAPATTHDFTLGAVGASGEPNQVKAHVGKEWIVGLMRSISAEIAPHYSWLTTATSRPSVTSEIPATPAASTAGATDAPPADPATKGRETVGAVITHWMPARREVYVSGMWDGAAALWQCKRDDGVMEHLEEDEVREM